jgi:xylulokinase
MGLEIAQIRIGEGGARSPLWRQIQADIFAAPVHPLETRDASAVGAALIAGVGTGLWPDFPTACAACIRVGPPVTPVAQNVERYAEGYAVFQGLYQDLRERFGMIAAL